jgi:hypothetical protein
MRIGLSVVVLASGRTLIGVGLRSFVVIADRMVPTGLVLLLINLPETISDLDVTIALETLDRLVSNEIFVDLDLGVPVVVVIGEAHCRGPR